jgi:hypothetical protein
MLAETLDISIPTCLHISRNTVNTGTQNTLPTQTTIRRSLMLTRQDMQAEQLNHTSTIVSLMELGPITTAILEQSEAMLHTLGNTGLLSTLNIRPTLPPSIAESTPVMLSWLRSRN